MANKLTQPAEADHNTAANKATFLSHFRTISRAKVALDEVQGTYRSLLKAAKKDGVNQKQLIAAMNARRLDPEDVAKDHRDYARYMEWMGLPIGAQGHLFVADGMPDDDGSMTSAEDREQKLWDAEEAGYKAGRHGAKSSENPFPAGSEFAQKWDEQWRRGQAYIASQMGPGITNVAAPKRGGGTPGRKKKGAVVAAPTPEPEAETADDAGGDDLETVH